MILFSFFVPVGKGIEPITPLEVGVLDIFCHSTRHTITAHRWMAPFGLSFSCRISVLLPTYLDLLVEQWQRSLLIVLSTTQITSFGGQSLTLTRETMVA